MEGGGRYIDWTLGPEVHAPLDASARGDVRLSDDAGASALERGAVVATFLRGLVEVVTRLEAAGRAVVDLVDEPGSFTALRDGEGFEMDYERTTLRYESLARFIAALADSVDGYLASIGAASTVGAASAPVVISELRDFAARHVSS